MAGLDLDLVGLGRQGAVLLHRDDLQEILPDLRGHQETRCQRKRDAGRDATAQRRQEGEGAATVVDADRISHEDPAANFADAGLRRDAADIDAGIGHTRERRRLGARKAVIAHHAAVFLQPYRLQAVRGRHHGVAHEDDLGPGRQAGGRNCQLDRRIERVVAQLEPERGGKREPWRHTGWQVGFRERIDRHRRVIAECARRHGDDQAAGPLDDSSPGADRPLAGGGHFFHLHRDDAFGHAVDHGDVGRPDRQAGQQAVGAHRDDVGVGHEILCAGGRGSQREFFLQPGQNLPCAAAGESHRARVDFQTGDVEELLLQVHREPDAEGGGGLQAVAGDLDDAAAIGLGREATGRADGQRAGIGGLEMQVGGRQCHPLLVSEVSDDVQQMLFTTGQTELAFAEVEVDQRCVAHVEAHEHRCRGVEAVIGRQGDASLQAAVPGVGVENHGLPVARHAGRAVLRADDTQVERIALRVADEAEDRLGRLQVDVGHERLRRNRRRHVGGKTKRLEEELAVAGIHAAVAVRISRRVVARVTAAGAQCQVDGLAVQAIDHAVERGVPGHRELQAIGAGRCAADIQHLQTRLRDAEQRIRAVALRACDQRRQAVDRRQRRRQGLDTRTFDHDAQVQSAAGTGAHFARPHDETEPLGGARAVRTVIGSVQIVQRAAEVRGQRSQRRMVAVLDHTSAAAAHDTQQVCVVQRVAVGGRRFLHQLAHPGQVAVFIVVDILVAVGRDHPHDAAVRIRHGADRCAVRREDAAIGHRQLHAVGVHDLAHALRRADAVQCSVRRT